MGAASGRDLSLNDSQGRIGPTWASPPRSSARSAWLFRLRDRQQTRQCLIPLEQEGDAFGVGLERRLFAPGPGFAFDIGGIDGAIKLLVRFDEYRWHGQRVIQVGQGRVRKLRPRIQHPLPRRNRMSRDSLSVTAALVVQRHGAG